MVYTGFSAVIGSSKITETSRPRMERNSRASAPTSCRPPSSMDPRRWLFIGNSPSSDIAVVDLPEPDSPTMASTPPRFRSKLAPTTAGYQVPSTQKSMSRSRTASTGALTVVVTAKPPSPQKYPAKKMQRWADVDRVPANREPGVGRRDRRDQRHRAAGAARRPGHRRSTAVRAVGGAARGAGLGDLLEPENPGRRIRS